MSINKMKTIIIIKLCVALLLTYLPDGVRTEPISNILHKIANDGDVIDWIFKPSVNGSLHCRGPGIMYKGAFLPLRNMTVAMKFWTPEKLEAAKREYEIYTYLHAINNPSVEVHRIPSIYYYGTWKYNSNSYTIMAMTLLVSPFREGIEKSSQLTEVDILIVFREFIKAMKYIHSQGIVNNNIYIEDMISHKGQSFMFDFGESEALTKETGKEYKERTKRDINRLLDSRFIGARFWSIVENSYRKYQKDEEDDISGLHEIYWEFEEYVIYDESDNESGIPFYDDFYRLINEQMKNAGEEATSSNPSLPSIPNAFVTFEWSHPPVVYDYFEKMYSGYKEKARKNSGKAESSKSGRNSLKRTFPS